MRLSMNANAPAAKHSFLYDGVVLRSKHDYSGSREHSREFPASLETVERRHEQIKDDDVWLQPCSLFEQPCAVLGAPHYLVVVLREQSTNPRD